MKENREKPDQEELEKCKASFTYFYNNYIRKEGDPEISEEEYLQRVQQIRTAQMLGRGSRVISDRLYPLTPDDCFKPLPIQFKEPGKGERPNIRIVDELHDINPEDFKNAIPDFSKTDKKVIITGTPGKDI